MTPRLLFLALLFLFSILAQAKSSTVDLSTLSPQLQSDLKKQFQFLSDKDIRKSELDNLIRYLVTQEQYETVQFQEETNGDRTIYHLNVGRTRHISQLRILGADYFSESQIRSELGIGEKSVFDQEALIEGGDRIRRMYREKGFYNTTIDLEFARLSESEVAVDFKVKEGPQTKVTEVHLSAANPEFQRYYQRVLERKLIGKPYTESLLTNLRTEMRELFSEKRYLKADLSTPEISTSKDESKVTLKFTVPNSVQYLIDFRGVVQKGRGSVEDALDLDHFFSTNPNMGPELATRVKNYYLSQGYARVEVTGDEYETNEPYHKNLILSVTEGPRVHIKELRITGRYTNPESYYIDFIRRHSSELLKDGYYNRDDLDTGLKNLIIDRQNHGFLKAKVISVKTAYSGDKKDYIQITVNIDEGPITILEKLSFEGNNSFSEDQLMQIIGLRPNESIRLNLLEEGIAKLKDFYHNSGYLEMSLLNEKEDLVQYNSDSTLADVKFKIYEGPKVIVGSIIVEGNSITKDYVVLKELDFKVGDTLTPQLIEESIRRLQRLGHFNTVDIKTLEEKTQISQRTVIVRAIDRDPGLFTVGAGVNSEMGLTVRGYMGIAYRNIMGTGRGISARVEGNYNTTSVRYLEEKVNVSYLEPYLFNSRTNGRVNYTLAEYVSDFQTRRGTQSKQITWTLEQNITSHLFASYDVWSSNQYRDFPLDSSNPNNLPRTETVIVTTGPNLDIDFRDHPFNPTTGTFTRLNAEYGSPQLGSSRSIQYLRGTASFTHYKSFFKPGWVWANSVRGGFIRNLSPEGGVPYDKKGFTLGGQTTIRGFQPDEAFPNRSDFGLADSDSSQILLAGTSTMYLLKSEIRFPIKGAFGGALFYDGGAIFVQDVNFQNDFSTTSRTISFSDPYRDAAGVALRYNTPVGAVSLELGYKLDRREDRHESQWPIFFSIGTF